jgi:hypothetical protein
MLTFKSFINELSSKTMGSYVNKAHRDKEDYIHTLTTSGRSDADKLRATRKFKTRNKGIERAINKIATKEAKGDPCWDDYEMIGHKKKNGKKVPNCVPKKTNEDRELQELSKDTVRKYFAAANNDREKQYSKTMRPNISDNLKKKTEKRIEKRTQGLKRATNKILGGK